MKNWYVAAMAGQKEDGTTYTICTQRFYIDKDCIKADLSDVFKNTGFNFKSVQFRAYIAKHSRLMVGKDGARLPMADLIDVQGILMGALTGGFGEGVNTQDVMAYAVHLNNVLAKNALAAYLSEQAKCLGDDGGGDA